MDRLQCIAMHVLAAGANNGAALTQSATSSTMSGSVKSDDDVVICSALRTPIAKANRGGFKDTPCEEMLAPLFKATLERTNVVAKDIGDIQIGNVSQPGAGAVTSRMAQFMGDLPFEVPLSTVNRQCSSGLQAVANIASSIRAGVIDVGIAGGVESMTMYNMASSVDPTKFSTKIADNALAMTCLVPMGITSENVPEATKVKDKDGNATEVVIKDDEGPREGTTLEGLSKLKAAFKPGGSTTAGNSSQVSDGAAVVLLARRSAARRLGLPVLARMRSYAVVGVDPKLMGIGPAFAIPAALEKASLSTKDVDIFEINEAFASQATMTVEHLKIPMEKVNPKGGAIALGHPLGCTGSRQIATLLPELRRTGGKLGVVSMCIGTGMGAASVIESEQ